MFNADVEENDQQWFTETKLPLLRKQKQSQLPKVDLKKCKSAIGGIVHK